MKLLQGHPLHNLPPNLLLWGSELVAQERQRAEEAKQKAAKLTEKLQSMGINSEEI